MRHIFMVIGLCVGFIALSSRWAGGQDSKRSGDNGRMKVAILEYRAVGLGYGLSESLGQTLANSVSTALSNSGRFEVYERQRLKTLLQEQGIGASGLVDPETAAQVGKLTGVQYVVYGEVESANCEVGQTQYTDKKGYVHTYYSPRAEVTVHHVITDVEKGQKWKETRVPGYASDFSEVYPSQQTFRTLCLQACERTVAAFVRQLVPTLQGQVIGKTKHNGKDVAIVNMGRKHGVGWDVDVMFYRYKEVRDLSGEIVKDPESGEPSRVMEPVQAIARRGHKEPSSCVGRPVQIQENLCFVEVGYYGQPSITDPRAVIFKPSDSCLAEVQKGDIAVTSPRQ